jgi:prephenate dehydrogenase
MKTDITAHRKSLGIVGFGAFGQLAAAHLNPFFDVYAYDPMPVCADVADCLQVRLCGLETVSRCDIVLIAAPVARFEAVVTKIAMTCQPDALIVDVGSVKVKPAEIMKRLLPRNVNIVATHPLFGPQSATCGITGLKIAVCPIRGRQHVPLVTFLKGSLGLEVIMTTPEDHDREVAVVQGLTHLIAKVLRDMGPLPSSMTTKSFDLLAQAVAMVQGDAPEVFDAIENDNPYAEQVRRDFFRRAAALNAELQRPMAP